MTRLQTASRWLATWRWDRWSRGKSWDELRVAGNSGTVKLSIIFPFVGYLILFNDQVVQFLSMHALDQHGSMTGSWRLYCLYFGLMGLGLGSGIYQARCPFIVKKHGDWEDYIRLDGDSLSTNTMKALGKALGHNYDLDELVKGHDNVGLEYMQEWYELQSIKHKWARISVTILFDLGFWLLAIPSAVSALNILLRLVR